MQKTKCYLAALVSGVLLVTGILAGYGQSKKNDHLTVYLWENRLMKNIASYDVVSKYYSYAVQFRRRLLPTRHCLISMESKFRKIMKNTYRFASNFMIRV